VGSTDVEGVIGVRPAAGFQGVGLEEKDEPKAGKLRLTAKTRHREKKEENNRSPRGSPTGRSIKGERTSRQLGTQPSSTSNKELSKAQVRKSTGKGKNPLLLDTGENICERETRHKKK